VNDDYISRSAGIIALAHRKCGNDEYDIAVQDCIETLKHLPAADVKPVVRSYWEKEPDGGYVCHECRQCPLLDGSEADALSDFCPSCGAEMRKEQEHNG